MLRNKLIKLNEASLQSIHHTNQNIRRVKNVTQTWSTTSKPTVMIKPASAKQLIDMNVGMKAIRQSMKEDLGQKQYDARMQSNREWFEQYTAIQVRS